MANEAPQRDDYLFMLHGMYFLSEDVTPSCSSNAYVKILSLKAFWMILTDGHDTNTNEI